MMLKTSEPVHYLLPIAGAVGYAIAENHPYRIHIGWLIGVCLY